MSTNSFFNSFNSYIDFNSFSASQIKDAEAIIVKEVKDKLNIIISTENNSFENVMRPLDDLYHELSLVLYPIYLMGSAHPDELVRKASDEVVANLSKFQNELNLNEDLYKKVKLFSLTDEAKKLSGVHKKFTDETVRDFERNGFSLSKEKRDELKMIQDKLADLSIKFHSNIAEAKDELILSEAELIGLPDDYKSAHKQKNGSYKITLDYPSYVPFMKYSELEPNRKILYKKYLNRAKETNLSVLKDILFERKKMASLLGYKTFAEYNVENRMVKTPETIWTFEKELSDKVNLKAKKDYDELLEIKKAYLKNEEESLVNPWEKGFYNNQLVKEKYLLDNEELKTYFELDNVISGLFSISEKLFNVSFKEIKSASVWHVDVRLFEILDGENVVGRFYTDLFPRENKYGHAACFGVSEGKLTPEGYQIPTAALVCNFPKATEENPSLLLHDDVVTLFHEFGHVIHSVMTESEIGVYSGTSVSRDFVETPSQMFENFAWSYESLSLFATHYKTGELLPKDLHRKMVDSKNVGSGLDTQQQIFYGLIDMTFHDDKCDFETQSTTEIIKELQKSHTYFEQLEGTCFEASFGHLDGYAAGYYGYLWSKVYAEDFFSEFEKEGVLSAKVGDKYRSIILAKGGSVDEFDLVEQFLGRKPTNDAFLNSLGV